jgi:peroxiredoxin/outer membrane lipoprotein-sorting protein
VGITTSALCVAAPTPKDSGQQGTGGDTRALSLISRMSKFYAGLSSMSYSVSTSSSVKHGSTEEKHNADYDIRLGKPLSLAVDTTGGNNPDKAEGRLNENDFVIYVPTRGYMKMKASTVPAEVRLYADLSALTSRELALFGFLGVVSAKDPMKILSMCKPLKIDKIKFVGSEKIGGAITQHVELVSNPEVGLQWDIWIKDGDKPRISRTVTRLNNGKNPVKVEITTSFSNWQDNPKFGGGTFMFVPPAGAREIKGPRDQGGPSAEQLKGKAAPAIKLSTIDGKSFTLAGSKGKEVVVLDFWATWCGPCREALPVLAEVTGRYADKGVRFCAIDQKEDAGRVKEFLKSQGLKINCAIDTDGKVAKSYGVRGIPQSVIIGKDGRIKVIHVGFSEDLKARLPEELDAVLSGRDVE